MRFPVMFQRRKGATPAAMTVLGSETDPPTATLTSQPDNVLATKFDNTNGWPVHRIAVLYSGPGAAIPLKSNLYFWEDSTNAWHRINTTVDQVLTPNVVSFFDCVALLEAAPTKANQESPTNGNITAMLIVQNGATPDGTYTFAIGPDLTTAA